MLIYSLLYIRRIGKVSLTSEFVRSILRVYYYITHTILRTDPYQSP